MGRLTAFLVLAYIITAFAVVGAIPLLIVENPATSAFLWAIMFWGCASLLAILGVVSIRLPHQHHVTPY